MKIKLNKETIRIKPTPTKYIPHGLKIEFTRPENKNVESFATADIVAGKRHYDLPRRGRYVKRLSKAI